MADDISGSVVTLHQPRPRKAKTGAERARAYRERKKGGAPLPCMGFVKEAFQWGDRLAHLFSFVSFFCSI
jgi:hypothetical protein